MSSKAPGDGCEDVASRIAAWRERGAHRFDPVRFRFIEALARRAVPHGGQARRLLDDKAVTLLADYVADLERSGFMLDPAEPRVAADPQPVTVERAKRVHAAVSPRPPQSQAARSQAAGPRGALAELVDQLARHALPAADARHAAATVPAGTPAAPELKTLSYFRTTWSRLSADRRIAQSLAARPENPGPLNSHHLVQQALMLMREVSPEYLDCFISHVDALLWLQQAVDGSGPELKAPEPPAAAPADTARNGRRRVSAARRKTAAG